MRAESASETDNEREGDNMVRRLYNEGDNMVRRLYSQEFSSLRRKGSHVDLELEWSVLSWDTGSQGESLMCQCQLQEQEEYFVDGNAMDITI